jgi:hypothetical protein
MSERNPSYQPHRHLEPFGEPRTMAGQWDLSSLVTPVATAARAVTFADKESCSADVDTPVNQAGESAWDKFPQPATIPAGWDLSELLDRH